MRIVPTADGLNIVFTSFELDKVRKAAKDTPFNPRQVIERMAGCYSANFESDLQDIMDTLDEERSDKVIEDARNESASEYN